MLFIIKSLYVKYGVRAQAEFVWVENTKKGIPRIIWGYLIIEIPVHDKEDLVKSSYNSRPFSFWYILFQSHETFELNFKIQCFYDVHVA